MGKSAIRRAGIYGIIWLYLGGDLSLVKKTQGLLDHSHCITLAGLG